MNSTKELQKTILEIIENNPGIHLSKIAELLDLKISTLEQHLSLLKQSGKIEVLDMGGYRRYYLDFSRKKSRKKRTYAMRKIIYQTIEKNPGIRLAKIAEKINISMQLADYHLQQLGKIGKINPIQDDGSNITRYYVDTFKYGTDDRTILSSIRDEIPIKIVLLLIEYKTLTHKELYTKIGIYPSKLSYHLNKLLDNDIVNVTSCGKEKGYSLKNRDRIIKILNMYKIHVSFQLGMENIKDTWKDLNLL